MALAACGSGGSTSRSSLDARRVTERLKASTPTIGEVQVLNATNDPNQLLGRPGGYSSKTQFTDARCGSTSRTASGILEMDSGGSVEVFPSADGANRRAAYGRGLAQALPILTEYDFTHGPILLRICKAMTPAQADTLKQVLDKL